MTLRPFQSGALIALLAVGTALPLSAQDAERPQRGPDFATLDADGDGSITEAELQARGDARFAAADADGDGLLTAEEMLAQVETERAERLERRVQRMIEARDESGDGALTREELGNARAERMLERADRDEDGVISEEEFERAASRHERGDRGKRHGHRGGPDRDGPPRN
ncbi:MAG: EF-hand domain-containing protein [Pseudomonadota bacterium]